MAHDPFDDVLNLEDKIFKEGYVQGVQDGTKAGRIEGRSFGLEKGFGKFTEAGQLQGRAVVWASRIAGGVTNTLDSAGPESVASPEQQEPALPSLPRNVRVERNIADLYSLVEPETLSTENTDDAVADFDDRLKRAHGKARVIEKAIGEPSRSDSAAASRPS